MVVKITHFRKWREVRASTIATLSGESSPDQVEAKKKKKNLRRTLLEFAFVQKLSVHKFPKKTGCAKGVQGEHKTDINAIYIFFIFLFYINK